MYPKNFPADVSEKYNQISLVFHPNNLPAVASRKKMFMIILRRVGLLRQVIIIMVLNQDQISN